MSIEHVMHRANQTFGTHVRKELLGLFGRDEVTVDSQRVVLGQYMTVLVHSI